MTLYLDARTNCSDLMVDSSKFSYQTERSYLSTGIKAELTVMMPDLVPDTRESTSMKSTPMDGWMIFGK